MHAGLRTAVAGALDDYSAPVRMLSADFFIEGHGSLEINVINDGDVTVDQLVVGSIPTAGAE